MPFRTITGEPGTSWTNDTGKVHWQLHVKFRNSCGFCIQFAGAIAPFWPLPLHVNCNCTQTVVRPGDTAKPFIDFQKELADLPHSQHVAAVGASNWKLIEAGVVDWADVVTPGRIRTFREVVRREKLSPDTLKDAGVAKGVIEQAYKVIRSPENEAAKARQQQIAASLRGLGVSDERIKRELSGDLAARMGVVPIGNRPPRPPAGPPVPPVAPQPAPTRPRPLAPLAKPEPRPQPIPVPVAAPKPRPPVPNIPPAPAPSASWLKRAVESFNRFVEAIKSKARRKAKETR